MDTETFLVQNQIFTIDEAGNALGIEKNKSTLGNLLAYYLPRGRIVRIRKGGFIGFPTSAKI